MSWNLRYFRF
jgi:hypothetical protein